MGIRSSSTGDAGLLPDELKARIEAAVGASIVAWTKPDCGLSAAVRLSLRFDDGSRCFVKAATDNDTEAWLRTEHHVLSRVAAGCMARIVHWLDGGNGRPVLIVEDLGHAHWPASHAGVDWRPGDIDRVLAGIDGLSTLSPPEDLARLANPSDSRWARIAEEPSGFQAQGLASVRWLRRHAAALADAEAGLRRAGNDLVHGDIRSDNICLLEGRAIFVDWSNAAIGNGRLNLASSLSGLHLEGGPPPARIMPEGGPWAAWSSAEIVERLAREGWEPAWLRRVLRRFAAIELDWAAEVLGLEPRDGPDWRAI